MASCQNKFPAFENDSRPRPQKIFPASIAVRRVQSFSKVSTSPAGRKGSSQAPLCGLPPSPSPAKHAAVLTKGELQRLRSLRDQRTREELGLFVLEGEKVVAELLAANFPFVELYATTDWAGAPLSVSGSTVPPTTLV